MKMKQTQAKKKKFVHIGVILSVLLFSSTYIGINQDFNNRNSKKIQIFASNSFSTENSTELPYINDFEIEQNEKKLTLSTSPELNQNQVFTIRYNVIYCEGMDYSLTLSNSSGYYDEFPGEFGYNLTSSANITTSMKIEQIGTYVVTLLLKSYNYTSGKSVESLTNSFEFDIVKNQDTDFSPYFLIAGAIAILAMFGIGFYNNLIEKVAGKSIQKYVTGSNLDPTISKLIQQDIFLSNKEINLILSRIKKSNYVDVSLDEIDENDFIKSLK